MNCCGDDDDGCEKKSRKILRLLIPQLLSRLLNPEGDSDLLENKKMLFPEEVTR